MKPLEGRRILVTRPESEGADRLVDALTAAGADVVRFPVIRILPVESFQQLDRIISGLERFGTIVFLSSAGVEHFFARFRDLRPTDSLPAATVVAIGSATATRLEDFGWSADLIPEKSNSDSVADCILGSAAPEPVLILRANRGSEVLGDRLLEAGVDFEEVTVYRSLDTDPVDPDLESQLRGGEFAWVTITSSAIARSTVALFGDAVLRTRAACISPIAAAAFVRAVAALKLECPDLPVVADGYNFAGLVQAITQSELKSRETKNGPESENSREID